MKPGNKYYFLTILFIFFYNIILNAEDKILSSPLVNLNELQQVSKKVTTQLQMIKLAMI